MKKLCSLALVIGIAGAGVLPLHAQNGAQQAGSTDPAKKGSNFPAPTPVYDFEGAAKRIESGAIQINAVGSSVSESSVHGGSASAVRNGGPNIPQNWQPPHAVLNGTGVAAATEAGGFVEALDVPAPGKDGRVIYVYGAGMPVLVCAPFRLCSLELQPGEHLTGKPEIGDSVRWEVTPVATGSGADETTEVTFKAQSAGLDTDVVVPTDRRAYRLRLISDTRRYIPVVAFQYPSDDAEKWKAYQAQQERIKKQAAEESTRRVEQRSAERDKADGVVPLADGALDKCYFEYSIKGDSHFRPSRVFDDGQKTYIFMPNPERFHETPALLISVKGKKNEIVNYRVDKDRYIVDRLFNRAVLLVGVGKQQQKVEIVRAQAY
jgi:P-type conjugative transfer protein TrbG